MPSTLRIDTEKKRAAAAIVSAIVMIALIGAYAVFVNPGFKPSKVTITGTVTALGAAVDRIAFTNTGCGTRSEAPVSSNGDGSGTYTISVDNEYSYNVSAAWRGSDGALFETEIGTITLDTSNECLVRDWTIQP
jgi:hypothetical protein